jgi:hypothetical protein
MTLGKGERMLQHTELPLRFCIDVEHIGTWVKVLKQMAAAV